MKHDFSEAMKILGQINDKYGNKPKCPICDATLATNQHFMDYGTVLESTERCERCRLYTYEFLYGTYIYQIGYLNDLRSSYSDSYAETKAFYAKVKALTFRWRFYWQTGLWRLMWLIFACRLWLQWHLWWRIGKCR